METITSTDLQIPKEIETSIYIINPLILEWLSILETWLPIPQSSFHIDTWMEEAIEIAESELFQFTPKTYSTWQIIQTLLTLYESKFRKKFITSTFTNTISSDIINRINQVLKKTQTTQRTNAWYLEQQNLLTGSEIGDLFETTSTRQSLIWSKVIPKEQRVTSNQAVPYEYLTPFDWGHRFEPVVKMLLEWKYNIRIAELGRIGHPTEPRLAASPDGIIIESTSSESQGLVGCLVEIKCPISRKPDGRISSKYYHQIQLQLSVTELDECIFTEYVFISGYKKEFDPVASGWVDAVQSGKPHGRIFIIEKEDKNEILSEQIITEDESLVSAMKVSHRYEYGPINNLTWEPDIDRTCEHIVETMPWALTTVVEQHVKKDNEWWLKSVPIIREFWREVDRLRDEYSKGRIVPPTPRRRQPIPVNFESQEQICVIKL